MCKDNVLRTVLPTRKILTINTECGNINTVNGILPLSDLFPFAGVSMIKRKLAAHDNLKLTITQEGNKFTVQESSTFRDTEIVFELGVTFNYSLTDGTELCVRIFFFL